VGQIYITCETLIHCGIEKREVHDHAYDDSLIRISKGESEILNIIRD
jgi:hypothetical protein